MKAKENKSHENAVVTIEWIGPKEAQDYLSKLFEGQRHLREGHVLRLASEMESGHWHLSPDSILLVRGTLANGQHRLQAVLLVGKAFPFIVMRSNDLELYKVLDSGVLRTTHDALGEIPHAKTIAAAAKLILSYDCGALTLTGTNYDKSSRITRSMVLDYIEGNQDKLSTHVSECVSLNQNRRILSPTVSSAILHIGSRKNDDQALTFIRNLYIGGSADAAFDLREKLIRNATAKSKLPRGYIIGLLIKSYRSFLQGTRPGVLRITDNEPFPKMP